MNLLASNTISNISKFIPYCLINTSAIECYDGGCLTISSKLFTSVSGIVLLSCQAEEFDPDRVMGKMDPLKRKVGFLFSFVS